MKVREIEKADYQALHTDYSESVDALERAIAVLKKQAYARPQASLAQVANLKRLTLVPPEARKAIDLFLQNADEQPEGLAVSAPEAEGYEFQSHGIIEMLEKLLDKFIDEKTALEKDEMNTQHAYEMLMQDLKAQIEEAEADRAEKAEIKAKKLQAKADAEGDLEDTITTKEADEKYLAELTATCQQKATDFESRQQLRAEELVAIEKAIEIISGEAVAGSANKHLPSSFTQSTASALAQLRATSSQGVSQARAA